ISGGCSISCYNAYDIIFRPLPDISRSGQTSFMVSISEPDRIFPMEHMQLKVNGELIEMEPDEPWIIEVPNDQLDEMMHWDYEFNSTSPNTGHSWSSNVIPSFGMTEIRHVE
ncbi:MAG: hypothetical protein AAFN65_11215, partial [Bacteroidota bacterium]